MPIFQRILTALLMTASASVLAQAFPEKPITLIVPYAPGGSSDRMARLIAPKMGERLGKPVVVENKTGADAAIGAMHVINAKPDGYTILLGDTGALAVAPAMKTLTYDLSKLVAVGQLASVPHILVVSPSLGVKSWPELVRLSKTRAGGLDFASTSATVLLGMEQMKQATGLDVTVVNFSGGNPALQSVIGGQVGILISSPVVLKPYVDGGQVTAITIAAPARSALLPNVPTLEELGVSGVHIEPFVGIFAPRGTPPEVIAKLNQALSEVLNDPAVERELTSGHGAVVGKDRSADSMQRVIDSQRVTWARIAKQAGMSPKP